MSQDHNRDAVTLSGTETPGDGGIVRLDDAECRQILSEQRLSVLSMIDGDVPYAIPLFYGFDGEQIWLGISEGRKTQLLDRNPRICLSVSDLGAGDAWRSVLVTGRAAWVTDPEQRAKGIAVLMEHNRRLRRSVTDPSAGQTAPRRRHSGGRMMVIADTVITGRARR